MLGPLFRAGALVGVTVPWSVVALFALLASRGRFLTPIAQQWARQLLMLCGVKVEVFGLDEPLDEPAYLVMSNHTSHFDVVSIYSVTPIDMRPVAKKELGAIPFFGWALSLGAAIMIDRKNTERAHASIERAAKTIRGGRSVLVFPEGTRTPTEEFGALKKGPFHLAQAARVPVLPVAVLGTHDILPSGDWRIRPGTVQVRYGKAIPTDDLPSGEEGRERLMRQVREAVAELVRQGRSEGELQA
ncbi:MAG: lysophospholipid acyltransferase family protein [Myxococcota bacterium]